MKINIFNDTWNNVNNKEELIELLKEYRGILTNSMLNYLNSLIELEFSVIRNILMIMTEKHYLNKKYIKE